jgi:hypothetical protein
VRAFGQGPLAYASPARVLTIDNTNNGGIITFNDFAVIGYNVNLHEDYVEFLIPGAYYVAWDLNGTLFLTTNNQINVSAGMSEIPDPDPSSLITPSTVEVYVTPGEEFHLSTRFLTAAYSPGDVLYLKFFYNGVIPTGEVDRLEYGRGTKVVVVYLGEDPVFP